MKVENSYSHSGLPKNQRGVALLIALVFLLIITLFSLSASQVSIQQERMAGNHRETNEAFQAAESTLREIERRLVQLSQGSGGFSDPIPIWTDLNLARFDCTGEEAWSSDWNLPPWRDDADNCQHDDGCYIVIEISEVDDAGEVVGSSCRPMEDSLSLAGGHYMVLARAQGPAGVGEAIVQSIYYWP